MTRVRAGAAVPGTRLGNQTPVGRHHVDARGRTPQARSALDATVSGWVGHTVDDAGVEAIIEDDTGGRAKSGPD